MFVLIWTLLIFVAVWFLLLRPQRKRVQEHQALVASLQVGHRVVTAGGIHGRIEGIHGDLVRLEVAPGTVVELDKRAIARNLDRPEPTVDRDGETGAGSDDDE